MAFKSVDLKSIKRRVASRDSIILGQNGALASASSALTAAGASASAPDIPLTILLNGVYVGYHHDGGTRGSTGEFLWQATITDGEHVVVTDSKKLLGGTGIVEDVHSGTWLNLERVPLYSSTKAPKHGAVSVGFRLIEDDDSDEAKAIFAGVGGVAKAVLTAYTGNPHVIPITDSIVSLAHSLMAVDSADVALAAIKGHIGSTHHYGVGRFFSMWESHHGSTAIFAMVPTLESPASDFAYFQEEFPGPNSESEIDVKQEGQLSLFLKSIWWPGMPSSKVTITDEKGASRTFSYKRAHCVALKVKPGKHTIRSWSLFPVRAEAMYTVFAENLAKDTFPG